MGDESVCEVVVVESVVDIRDQPRVHQLLMLHLLSFLSVLLRVFDQLLFVESHLEWHLYVAFEAHEMGLKLFFEVLGCAQKQLLSGSLMLKP